jgi:hypothetical protein
MKGPALNIITMERPDTPELRDGDSEEGGENHTFQITVDVAENGFVYTKNDAEEITQSVFLFNGPPEAGAKALIQRIIEDLGLPDKVKLVK